MRRRTSCNGHVRRARLVRAYSDHYDGYEYDAYDGDDYDEDHCDEDPCEDMTYGFHMTY